MGEQTAIWLATEQPAGREPCPDFMVGDAVVQPSVNRICVGGRIEQVEPKAMQVLVLMASRPGAVLSREALLASVWGGAGADDYLLNRTISSLRKIFSDDAQTPHYIETIRKAGYRLIAPVGPTKPVSPGPSAVVDTPALEGAPPMTNVASPLSARTPSTRLLIALLATAAVMLGAFMAHQRSAAPEGTARGNFGYDIRPLTSFMGRELDPAFSPDASRVAFAWDGGERGSFDIYLKTIDSEAVLNLTQHRADERYPAWSADGRSVLFARMDDQGAQIMRVSTLGGGATTVSANLALTHIRGVAVSPDGRQLAFAGRQSATSPYRVALASTETGEAHFLTSPKEGSLGDIEPIFTADGRSLVFVRGVTEVTKDLYSLPVAGGEPTRITFDNRKINGLARSPQANRLLFTSTRSGMYRLWSVPVEGGEPVQAKLEHESVQRPATVAGRDVIAFEEWRHRSQLRRIDISRRDGQSAARHVGSTRWDSAPSYSPDGAQLVFSSNRAGPPGIWVSDRGGQNAVQIATLEGAFVDRPAWSPDGQKIAFDASPEGTSCIYLVSPEGGALQRIASGPGDTRNPAWSRDGSWIYFESNRDGDWHIYAIPVSGAEPVDIAVGTAPRESLDGKWLLYAKPDEQGIWRRPRSDWQNDKPGTEEQLTDELSLIDVTNWAPGGEGIYFVRRPAGDQPQLSLLSYADLGIADIAALPEKFEGWGLAVAPDESEVVLSEVMMSESDLLIAIPRAGR